MCATLGRKTGSGTYRNVCGDCRGDLLGDRASGFAGEVLLGAVVAAAPRTTSQMASARANCGDVLERRKAGLSARVTLMARGMGPGNAAAQAVATRAWSFPWNRSQPDAQRPVKGGRPRGCAAKCAHVREVQ